MAEVPSKSVDWFLYDRDIRHERVMLTFAKILDGSPVTSKLNITTIDELFVQFDLL